VALEQPDALRREEVALRLGLHPLGHHRQVQAARHRHDGLDDGRVVRVVRQVPDEGAVDLQLLIGSRFR